MTFWSDLLAWLATPVWGAYLVRILLYFLVAFLVFRLARRLARRLLQLSRLSPRKYRLRPERMETLHSLIASVISFVGFSVAGLLSLNLFVGGETIVWMVGLFSAAFGLGARPLIADFLTGVSFLFEDPFDVGEKVELLNVEGVVEKVNLRTTLMRAPTGELFMVPNGEIRIVRNFSRGRFSMANINLRVQAGELHRAIEALAALGTEAVHVLPNLLEPWQVISETGSVGPLTELTLVTKARFGQAAEMRPRLLALVQERLAEEGIELV